MILIMILITIKISSTFRYQIGGKALLYRIVAIARYKKYMAEQTCATNKMILIMILITVKISSTFRYQIGGKALLYRIVAITRH
jgi:hypothetical protein